MGALPGALTHYAPYHWGGGAALFRAPDYPCTGEEVRGKLGPHTSTATTMEDVARATGCSINTVSRTLNDKPDISAETRARVLAVVERLGYVRHAPARARGRTHAHHRFGDAEPG